MADDACHRLEERDDASDVSQETPHGSGSSSPWGRVLVGLSSQGARAGDGCGFAGIDMMNAWRAAGFALGTACVIGPWYLMRSETGVMSSTRSDPTAVLDEVAIVALPPEDEADRMDRGGAGLETVAPPVPPAVEPLDATSADDGPDQSARPEASDPIDGEASDVSGDDVGEETEPAGAEDIASLDPPPTTGPRWSAVWRPFLSERTASGFAEYIGEATGLALRVGEPDESGRYDVEVEHRTDAERAAAIERIVQATGYRPVER